MEYVTEMAIDRVSQEFQSLELDWFLQYALIKTTVKDYVRASQTRSILDPIGAELRRMFGSSESLPQQMLKVLAQLRHAESKFSGYGAGNLINFGNYLQMAMPLKSLRSPGIRTIASSPAVPKTVRFDSGSQILAPASIP